MSMSNLGDQLAALSSTTSTGFVQSTSRSKTDSIGRGFHHSSIHGHSLGGGGVVKEKVSVLYENAREAAAVNLIDLRDSAVDALNVLSAAASEAYCSTSNSTTNDSNNAALEPMWKNSEFIGQNGLLSHHNLSYERGMATSQQNKEIDQSIEKLLHLISTLIMEIPPQEFSQDYNNNNNNNPILLSSLQIIEYLLRRYEIHARPNTSAILLQTLLPLQVCYPTSKTTSSIFSRIVSLIDLQMIPTWTFLRPYAAKGAPPLSRMGLVKKVAKDDALVGIIANIGKIGRDVCLEEGKAMRDEVVVDGHHPEEEEEGGKGKGAYRCVVRRGISKLISFSASILVETLYHQSKSQEGSVKSGGAITTGVQESMVRKILPLVLTALRHGVVNNNDDDGNDNTTTLFCPEWKEWGRLLAATLAMLSPLNDNVKEALCNSAVEGMPNPSLVKGEKKLMYSDVLESSRSRPLSVEEVDDATSAIMTLISITGSSAIVDETTTSSKETGDDWDFYLPMLPPSKNRRSNIVDYMGVAIASSTYRILSKNSSTIAVALGAILKSIYGDSVEDDDGDVSNHDILDRMVPFVASLVMHALHRMEKEGKKALKATDGGAKKKKGGEKFKADRDVIMIIRLIKEPCLARLWNFNHSSLTAAVCVQLVNSYNDLYRESSKSSSKILTEGYKSILNALSGVNSSVRDQGVAYAINTIDEGKLQTPHLSLLLGSNDTLLQASKSTLKKDDRAEDAEVAVSSLLPLRVALEHADSQIRLDAVVRLTEQIDNNNRDSFVIDGDLGQALLRRLCTEDDPEVAVTAGEILLSQLRVLEGSENEMDEDEPPLLLASLLDDLESLAKSALSALLHWTFIGTDISWSPLSSWESMKKEENGEQTSILLESPLTSCIGICGAVAKLIGDEINMDYMDGRDGDLNRLTRLYCTLFLAVAAHINGATTIENDDSDLTKTVSEVACVELLSFAKGGSLSNSVEEFITSSHIAEYVPEQCFSMKSVEAPNLLLNRFAWLALKAYSELNDSLSSRIDAAYRVIDLISFQMNSYTGESIKSEAFETETQFLLKTCDYYLSVLKAEDLDGFGKAIMKLASSSSEVSGDSIAKPAITSQLTPNASKADVAPGLVVLVHACLRSDATKDGIIRILKTAKAALKGGKVSNNVAIDCIVPAFALLSHHAREVRESVIEMLESIELAKKDDKVSLIYDKVIDKSSPLRSSLLMDGVGTLPQALSQIVLSFAHPADLQSFLIEQCKICALNKDDKIAYGGCQAASIILSAMERSGELVFPLTRRWEVGGRELFRSLIQLEADEFVANPSLYRLRDCVATMLKGVLVNTMQVDGDGMSIQISVGPSTTGRRARSYSIGAADSFSVLEPYPESMLQAILEALGSISSPLMLPQSVIMHAVGRQSWANGVFPKLDPKSKRSVASALLTLRTQHDIENAGAALLGLPMTALDFVQLLEDMNVSQSEDNQAAIVFITDCVREKADLGKISDIIKLSNTLFDQLLFLSSPDKNNVGDTGGRDYTRVSILQSLLGIHSQYKSQMSDLSVEDGKKRSKRSRSHSDVGSTNSLATQANILVGIVGGISSNIHPLSCGRGRSLALSLLTCLCEESPYTVPSSLLPALMSIARKHSSSDKGDQARDGVDSRVLSDALSAVIPAYCAYAKSANLSFFTLLESFVGKVIVPENENGKLRTHLIDPFINALKLLPTKEDSIDAIASLAVCVLALQAFNLKNEAETTAEENGHSAKLNCHVLSTSPSGIKIPISLLLLKYAEQLLSFICGDSSFSREELSSNLKADVSEVASLALRGADVIEGIPRSYLECTETQQRSILYLAICLLDMVRDVTGTNAVKRLLRKSQGDDADASLQLWQELLQAHMHALRAHAKLSEECKLRGKERKFWSAVPVAISECLENIQGLLPVPHFLASVSSTLADESTDAYLRKKTIRLLADRVAEVSLDSPEAALYLEMVPELVAQVSAAQPHETGDDDAVVTLKRSIIMQQGALVALESFVRSLCHVSEKSKLTSKAADAFVPALESVTKLFGSTAASWSKEESDKDDVEMLGIRDSECQLLSSCSLCLSSLVAVLKARCLRLLPSILKPLMSSLKSINLSVESTDFQSESSETMLQISILRLLETLADTLPQFLPPYLPLIFSKNALPSRALRRSESNSLKEATERVESALALKTPIRQLTPALSKALSNILDNSNDGVSGWEEACSILGVINASVETSERSELSPVIGKIFNVLVAAYGYEGEDDCRIRLLSDANKLLLSLVMKLSESQLRQLYARLREWRGDIKEGDGNLNQSCTRRVAFWSLSAALSKSLRSIFLPCLTSCLTDLIDELEIAVSRLCERSKPDGSKRRRINDSDNDSSVDDDSDVSPLQPLLLCLESALKADAHEGGDWTRGDDNQRYNMILSYLGKLLMAQVPKDIPLTSDLSQKEGAATSTYQKLVEGFGTLDHGNVVGCLTALAAAAGNEQLWKPLNFAVLKACSHKRPEVRKAGISCLLSIIETVGEEYMVLLPECLPVLSELLEEGDEEIAAMAKECVRQGEEMLGESLQDSLR